MDVKAQENTTLSCYPWLLSYRNGELQACWQHERDAILAVDTRLSQARAGMLARAKLTVLIVDEYAAFEQYALARCTKSQSACLTEEEDALYTCATEARFRQLQECNTTGIDVVKAAPYLQPKGLRGQEHGVKRPGGLST